jgi:hypothetical protein
VRGARVLTTVSPVRHEEEGRRTRGRFRTGIEQEPAGEEHTRRKEASKEQQKSPKSVAGKVCMYLF